MTRLPRGAICATPIVDVPDFPKPGILFRDIAPLLRAHFAATIRRSMACSRKRSGAAIDADRRHRVARIHSRRGARA